MPTALAMVVRRFNMTEFSAGDDASIDGRLEIIACDSCRAFSTWQLLHTAIGRASACSVGSRRQQKAKLGHSPSLSRSLARAPFTFVLEYSIAFRKAVSSCSCSFDHRLGRRESDVRCVAFPPLAAQVLSALLGRKIRRRVLSAAIETIHLVRCIL